MRIEAIGLSKTFEGKPILTDVSLSLHHPGIYALVGPNGSGKTTLMRLLAMLERPDSGFIKIDVMSANGAHVDTEGLRRRMVLVHNPAVMLSGSVLYNAEYGLKVRGFSKNQRRAQVAELLERLSLAGLEKREAKTLSAGEAQRLALVRALAIDPAVIFLDEPTANLDPLSSKLIERSILDLKCRGRVVIISSHNIWQVERLASWIWFLNNGRIELSGSTDQVLHSGDHAFWSSFLGRDNLYSGLIVRHNGKSFFQIGNNSFEVVSDIEGRAMASLNPAEVILSKKPIRSSARNVLKGRVKEVLSEGGLYRVTIDAGIPLTAAITRASIQELGIKTNDAIYAIFKASAVRVWRETE